MAMCQPPTTYFNQPCARQNLSPRIDGILIDAIAEARRIDEPALAVANIDGRLSDTTSAHDMAAVLREAQARPDRGFSSGTSGAGQSPDL